LEENEKFTPRSRRGWLALGAAGSLLAAFVLAPVTTLADNASGCDFAANGTTQSCSGPLSGSTFAGGDGNLSTNPTTFGTTDWQNVAGLNAGIDFPSGSGDNSFGQGTKEDNAAVTVVNGSIPPNKSDLTRFYEASEFANGSNFLYLAWERTNVLGSANMDFEINQATTPGLGTSGPHTINRTAGDLLVTFDFTNGGGTPTLGLLKWVTSGSTSQCFSSNSLPCWGNHVTLTNGTQSIGAVNNLDAVSDPIAPNAPRSLAALTFGEAAINLTAAGVFPPGTCEAFGSVFLKSRASASFGSEVKDFVAPVQVNISNCGEVIIVKNTDPRGISQDFAFQSTVTGTIKGTTTACPASYSLNDGSSSINTLDCANVPVGPYTASETEPSASFVLESLTCSAGGTQDVGNPLQADITVTPGATVTCTFVNKLQQGAIKISKTSIKGPVLGGATFAITGPGNYSNSVTTGADGTVCVDHLLFGTYSVQETAAPPGYSIDDTTAHNVTVGTTATCGSGNEATFSATDTPLTDIGATAVSEAAGGTSSTIVCRDANNNIGASAGPGESISASAIGLKPGTYTCTIVVDP
jgi:prealbumin domain-containing protein